MARVVREYPFSRYEVYEEERSKEAEELAAVLSDFLQRKVSSAQVCERAGISASRARPELEQLASKTDVTRIGRPIREAEKREFEKAVTDILKERPDAEHVARATVRRLHGYRLVGPLFEDPELEEIVINGTAEPVYVYHREHGMCKTNLQFSSEKELRGLIDQFGRPERGVSLDVKLVDGSRANTVFPPVVPEPVITIRKFRQQPWSIIDLMRNGTVSAELAAFLWMAVDGLRLFPLNLLVTGGTASGKTSTLNALSSFLPPEERVLTIEEVLELNLFGREDWVALEATPEAPIDELLRNSLRMRPDRIIVGEVRGKEAVTMFTAMNTGHRGSMGTIHANSDRDVVLRLENAPMNVPRQMIPLIDLVLVQHRVQDRRKGLIRRVTQVSEVSRIEDEIALNEIFKWNPQTDQIERTDLPSQSTEKVARALGVPIPEVLGEVKKRQEILAYLSQKDVHTQRDVNAFMREYYAQRAGVKAAG